LTENLIV